MNERYTYFKFNKGDKARLKEPVRAKVFVGGLSEIFKSKPGSYKFIEIPKGAIFTVSNLPEDKPIISSNSTYDIIYNGDTIIDIPEYLLERVEG